MKLAAHGIELDLPKGWDGRIYRIDGSAPILHAASFSLPARDGDFGSGATGRMPAGATFIAVKEYEAGPRLLPGEGLFASRSLPLPLAPARFHPRALQVGRLGQAGFQHFFTSSERPFCLYAVIKLHPPGAELATAAANQVSGLNRILSTLTIGRRR